MAFGVKRQLGIFAGSQETYGYRRVHAQLVRSGEQVGLGLVRDLMRGLDLRPCQPRPYRVTTVADVDGAAATPDLVAREFAAEAPGVKMVRDITHIPTWEGWLHLATVIDCHTKAVIGWSMAKRMKASLVCDAIGMAAANIMIAKDAIFHSDRGAQTGLNRWTQHRLLGARLVGHRMPRRVSSI